MYYGLGDCKSPGLIGRTFFTTDCKSVGTLGGVWDAWRGMGRLAGYGTLGGVWDAWRCVWDGWRGGISGHKKSRGILEGESPRQLKFQRPV